VVEADEQLGTASRRTRTIALAAHPSIMPWSLEFWMECLEGHRRRRATPCGFRAAAEDTHEGRRLITEGITPRGVMIDGERLGELMIAYGVGIETTDTYVVSEVDEDFFE
jgi:restriction endonuclease Mrr